MVAHPPSLRGRSSMDTQPTDPIATDEGTTTSTPTPDAAATDRSATQATWPGSAASGDFPPPSFAGTEAVFATRGANPDDLSVTGAVASVGPAVARADG